MNMQNARKMTSNVNYVKPELEMLEMVVEGAILTFSTGPEIGPPTKPGDPGAPGAIEGTGELDLFSSRPKMKRR